MTNKKSDVKKAFDRNPYLIDFTHSRVKKGIRRWR